jgi:hypothetical protein
VRFIISFSIVAHALIRHSSSRIIQDTSSLSLARCRLVSPDHTPACSAIIPPLFFSYHSNNALTLSITSVPAPSPTLSPLPHTLFILYLIQTPPGVPHLIIRCYLDSFFWVSVVLAVLTSSYAEDDDRRYLRTTEYHIPFTVLDSCILRGRVEVILYVAQSTADTHYTLGWMSPDFHGTICARGHHFTCFGGVVFGPCDNLVVNLWRRIGL